MSQQSEVHHTFAAMSLDLNNIDASCNDPRVEAMLRNGWKVQASLPIERGGRQELLLLMAKDGPVSAQINISAHMINAVVTMLSFQTLCLITIAIGFLSQSLK